jgi:hypothetical protein
MLDKVRPAGLATADRGNVGMRHGPHPLNSQNYAPIQARLAGSTVCTAAGLKVDTGSPVLAICRKLVNAGHHPDRALEAYSIAHSRCLSRGACCGARRHEPTQ